MKQHTTLVLLEKNGSVLLARKKRGFGAEKLNGCGGKVKDTETAVRAAVRETKEEFGIIVTQEALVRVAELTFRFEGKDLEVYCEVFMASVWEGDPIETEEMVPEGWFDLTTMPFERMWPGDRYWLPPVLEGNRVTASFQFSSEGTEVLFQEVYSDVR